MTFADECLDRANKATPGPWEKTLKNIDIGFYQTIYQKLVGVTGPKPSISMGGSEDAEADAEFIANSRTDVVELATRLKRACNMLRSEAICKDHYLGNTDHIHRLIEELEEPLGEK